VGVVAHADARVCTRVDVFDDRTIRDWPAPAPAWTTSIVHPARSDAAPGSLAGSSRVMVEEPTAAAIPSDSLTSWPPIAMSARAPTPAIDPAPPPSSLPATSPGMPAARGSSLSLYWPAVITPTYRPGATVNGITQRCRPAPSAPRSTGVPPVSRVTAFPAVSSSTKVGVIPAGTDWVAVAAVVESVYVTVPVVLPAVTGAVAWVSETTVTEPAVTPETPEAAKVGAVVAHFVPAPVKVTVVVAEVGIDDGEAASVCALLV
jgi:hypothetical protein